jgi:hypothetical protein
MSQVTETLKREAFLAILRCGINERQFNRDAMILEQKEILSPNNN